MATFSKPFRPAEGSKEQKDLNRESQKRSSEQNPSVNKDLWAEAEHAASNMTGGFAGVGAEGKRIQTQKAYDQMIKQDKELKEWAGGSGPGTLLGDI